MQRTLILLKPDCVQRRLMGHVLSQFENKGLNIIAMKMLRVTPELAAEHYAEHVEKPFYPNLEAFITGAPVVAMVIARKADFSPGVSKTTTRPTSPSPLTTAHAPMAMITVSATTTTEVSTTLSLMLSPTPRKLMAASAAMNPSASSATPNFDGSATPMPSKKFAEKARDAVDAEVIPEHMTTNATRNVTKWIPNALCAYNAAPAACGYLVTSSR